MDGFQIIYTIFATIMVYAEFSVADRERMVSKAESKIVSLTFETKLECIMNIQPDSFKWKFYPLDSKDVCNPKAQISLTSSPYRLVSPSKYENTTNKKSSSLILEADSIEIAGDYQCLAYYGASVFASVPWRVTIANITDLPKQHPIDVTVMVGNTINWRCEPPLVANPDPFVDYKKNGEYFKSLIPINTKSLIIPNVQTSHSGDYSCNVGNVETQRYSKVLLKLNVVKQLPSEKPHFIVQPKSVYNATKGETIFLECAAIGSPVPQVFWKKKNGNLSNRHRMDYGGLIIKNIEKTDQGIYECIHKNNMGVITHNIMLNYHEPPSIENCTADSVDAQQGQDLDLQCDVTGSPLPEISWFLNGFIVTNDNNIVTEGGKIIFKPTEKRHAGNLQIFARNVVGTEYHAIFIKVIPLPTTQENSGDNRENNREGRRKNSRKFNNKHYKMYPPSKPNISRINDETVSLRWEVVNEGLPIKFFKVQYKDLGSTNQHDSHSRAKSSKWITTNTDISKYVNTYEVNNLKPDHYYKFRIAAVYTNDDNKNSPNSDKFLLKRLDFDNKTPLPVPVITSVEPVNETSVKIHWKYDPKPGIDVEGFFVNYNFATTAADYMKATVDGKNATSYILSHLQPDTVYDIKLQSFTSKFASQFSDIHQVKTFAVASTSQPSTLPPSTHIESAGISKLYIIIAAGVIGGCSIILVAVGLVLFCRRSKQKKTTNRGGVDEHHIQADGNEYVVGPKSAPRSNGCVSVNRMTITANPLADADNKNQNMIEMSCLSSQNNNCSTVVQQPSVSGEDSTPTNSRDNNKKNKKRIRNKHVDSNTSGENFV